MVNREKGGNNHISNRVLLLVVRERLIHLVFGSYNQYQILHELRRMNKRGTLTKHINTMERLIRAKEHQARGALQKTG
jgi:hypothetical protein